MCIRDSFDPGRPLSDKRRIVSDASFSGSIPELYDRHLGPVLFEPYAADLAARLSQLPVHDLLETAAGTGVVTRALARALPGARLTATDLNQAMLDRAAQLTGPSQVTWRQADAQALPFADESFDVVVLTEVLEHLREYPARTLEEACRILTPGGLLVITTPNAAYVRKRVTLAMGRSVYLSLIHI